MSCRGSPSAVQMSFVLPESVREARAPATKNESSYKRARIRAADETSGGEIVLQCSGHSGVVGGGVELVGGVEGEVGPAVQRAEPVSRGLLPEMQRVQILYTI